MPPAPIPNSKRQWWLAVVAVLVIGVGLQLAAWQTHRDQVRIAATAKVEWRLERDRAAELAAVTVQLDQVSGEARAAAEALAAVRAQLVAAGSSEAAVAADVSAAQAALGQLGDATNAATASLDANGLRLLGMRQCVAGGQQALDLTATNPTGVAAKVLDSARAACAASAATP